MDSLGYVICFSYLYTMTNKEIIELLKEQIDAGREREMKLLEQISELTAEIASLKEALLKKGESLDKQKRIAKGLSKLMESSSEKQVPEPLLDGEELKRREEERKAARKARGNNGAKHDMHHELETVEHDVYPDNPDFDLQKARPLSDVQRVSVRYEFIPMRFIKHVYRIHAYTQDGQVMEGRTPPSAFLNSSYDASFVAGLLELRYLQSMPVERIVSCFTQHGFNLHKPTAHKLIAQASRTLENVYLAIRAQVLSDDYIGCDETYYRILVPERNASGKGTKKGYLWVIIGMKSRMMYVVYEDGSRASGVITDELKDFKGTLQSDGYAPYRTLQGKEYPDIERIACLQHAKRKFIDCGDDPKAMEMVQLVNGIYVEDHKHKVGKDGWTVKDNLKHRQEYSPKILEEIWTHLQDIRTDPNLPPKSELAAAAVYMENEWEAIKAIFNRGDTALDNNLVERYNRYFSISRRNSLFFGSHDGAERSAVLYTLALSCRMHKLDFFQYIKAVLEKTSEWQPNTPLSKYRELLPDKFSQNL